MRSYESALHEDSEKTLYGRDRRHESLAAGSSDGSGRKLSDSPKNRRHSLSSIPRVLDKNLGNLILHRDRDFIVGFGEVRREIGTPVSVAFDFTRQTVTSA